MYYVFICEDIENSFEARQQAPRDIHMARLKDLEAEGRLLVAGPCPAIDSNDPGPAGFSGSIIIAEFDSLQAAQEWADAEPYLAAGIYDRILVKPFKKVLLS